MSDNEPFMGMPVRGDIDSGQAPKEQKPMEELTPLFQALLDDKTVEVFGWHQYQPSFNDGDPCIFGAHGFWVRTTDPLPETNNYGEPWDLEEEGETFSVSYGHPTLGSRKRTWNHDRRDYGQEPYVGPDEDRYDRVTAAAQAVEGGHFDNVLQVTFGTSAQVRVTREGVDVEYYEHD